MLAQCYSMITVFWIYQTLNKSRIHIFTVFVLSRDTLINIKKRIIGNTLLKRGPNVLGKKKKKDLCNIKDTFHPHHLWCDSVFNFDSWSTESPVMLHRVLVGTFTHVMHTRVPDGETLFHNVVHEENP